MSRTRRRSHIRTTNRSSSSILSKDPYGLIWVALLFLSVLIAKWLFISPPDAQTTGLESCVLCVIFIVWFLSVLVSVLLMFFWILWSEKFSKSPLFVFIINVVIIVVALSAYKFVDYVVGKLFYSGVLRWQETQATYLFDEMLPHSMGLFLLVAILYSMVRILFCRELENRGFTITYSVLMALFAIPLMILGVWLY